MAFRLCAAVLLCAAAASGAGLTPYELECEARRDPVGIDATAPRLGWKLRADQPDQRQSAYQIVVEGAWDSGRVASPETAWIPYAGTALQPFHRYRWKVRVWDSAGNASPWSDMAEFTTALLDPAQARGAWISSPVRALRSGPLPILRKEVTIDRPLRRAVVLIAAPGFHELHLNGGKVGDHVLAPAWTNFRATVYYEAFDVTGLLKSGPNAIGVLVGNGFYNVAGGRYVKYSGSFGHPRLWLQMHLEFSDGTVKDVVTDSSWRVQDGPITFSCIYGGEDFDARLEAAGWDRAGFDDSGWAHAVTNEAPGGVLRAQPTPPLRVKQTFRPVKVTHPQAGITVYDLGQNFAGWPKITVSGAAGTTLRLTPGELLDGGGKVTQRSSGGPVWFSYTAKGSGLEEWSPRFTYYGFRYLQVEGTAEVRQVEGQFIQLDAPRIGSFSCSNPLLNRIHALIDAAVRSNLQHVLTDCPHREKLGWLEESYLMGPSILYNWDLRTFLPKITRDMREAQLVDGLVPDIAPEYVAFRGGFRDSPEWGSAAVLVPWLGWQWYGDRDLLAMAYPMMRSYVAYLGDKANDGVLGYGLGDWYDIGPKPPGVSQLTPLGLTATATYARDLQVLAEAAKILQQSEDARRFQDAASEARAAFLKAFYQPQAVSFATGSQTSLAMPLALGLAPAEVRVQLLDKLVRDVRARGNHTSAGDVGYTYVIRALLDGGRSDVIYDMATENTAPSYAAQLAAGATSLTEAWDANPHSSQNHFMLGHVEQWFYAGLAGIRPDPSAPGMTRLEIAPQAPQGIDWVKARWDTFRGPVGVEWRREGGKIRAVVDLPPGVSAVLPALHREIGSGRHEVELP